MVLSVGSKTRDSGCGVEGVVRRGLGEVMRRGRG